MFAAFLYSARLYLSLCAQSFSRKSDIGSLSWRGRLLRFFLYLLFLPVWLIHWLCLFLDEIFFFSYHLQELKRPLFILGVPRSGTTFLHRSIAEDEARFTSVSTWEVFLAPSILQKKFILMLGWIDRRIGHPGARLIKWLEKKLFAALEGVHDMELEAAEEDYLLLLPMLSCFILFLPFTESKHIWSLARFDWEASEQDKQRIMQFYRACLQKHMFVFARGANAHKRYLSKNAAFASWPVTLQEYFPDADFVICMRQPEKAVPSLLGSLESGIGLFDLQLERGELPEMLSSMMADYYEHLLCRFPKPAPIAHMESLKNNISASVAAIYGFHGDTVSAEFSERLNELEAESRQYKTRTNALQPKSEAVGEFYAGRFSHYYAREDEIRSALLSTELSSALPATSTTEDASRKPGND